MTPKRPDKTSVNAAVSQASRKAGRERTHQLHDGGDGTLLQAGGKPPRTTWRTTGNCLELHDDGGFASYHLGDKQLAVGDTIELYTNHANTWVRGRFEWSGQAADRPRFAINLWDPDGPQDADGLPPWIGDLEGPLPARAICRWPNR
jgi:hypothetical protein